MRLKEISIGVESFLPGEQDWWATIYSRWMGKHFSGKKLIRALRELGTEFTLCYDSLSKDKQDACCRITDLFGSAGIGFLFNNTYGDVHGPWVRGTGRAEYSDSDLEYASKSPHFMGIVRDELTHRQIHNYDCGPGPYLADVSGLNVEECYNAVISKAERIVARLSRWNCPNVAEYVFPTLHHLFARAGIAPGPKILKESCNPLMLAIGMGAAKQYDLPLWAVADLWGPEMYWETWSPRNPGHSPDEYLSSLMIAYWMGVRHLYTEGIYNLIYPIHTTSEELKELRDHPIGHRGENDPMTFEVRSKGYVLSIYGKYHRWFAQEYVPAHPRGYSHLDVEPTVAIIRFPDSCWCKRGYNSLVPKENQDLLFGPGGPPKEARHEAWLDLWHILTHGRVPETSLWFSAPKHGDRMESSAEHHPSSDHHAAFCPLNGVIVYDHLVPNHLIQDIPFLICTGETLSRETAKAVQNCVTKGASCLTLNHLAPEQIRSRFSGDPLLVNYGKGKYLVVAKFRNEATREFIEPFLGQPDEISYRFCGQDVVLRPVDGDPNRLTVERH